MQDSFFKKITYTDGIYPVLKIEQIENPSKFYAFPIIGILAKTILLIPVVIEIAFLVIWLLVVAVVINPFMVFFGGKYWLHAHNASLAVFRLTAKVIFYIYGLTDKYPGFDFSLPPRLILDIPLNQNPNKIFAAPVIGGLARGILLIPYMIFTNVVSQAATIGVFLIAWIFVLFKGKYPDGLFELARDSVRVELATAAYMLGLSDRYPSFYISMSNDKIKLILIAVVIILSSWNYSSK